MRHQIKNYLKDLRGILVLCLGVSGILSAGIILSGLLWGQLTDRDLMIGLFIVTGFLSVGGVLAVTVVHAAKWNTIRSEHFAPPSVESMDMDQLHQRIKEVQSHDKP
jgi:hypothetical protein